MLKLSFYRQSVKKHLFLYPIFFTEYKPLISSMLTNKP